MSLTFRVLVIALLALPPRAPACTAFSAAAKGRVLAVNNEDLFDPHTRI